MPAKTPDRSVIHDLVTFTVDELTAYHKNPRRGDVEQIARSLETNGQYRPIVVNLGTHTGRPLEVLAGNHTLAGAKRLGWTTIQATTVDVDDLAAARIVAADNRTADLGGYDDQVLADLLQQLAADDLGLDGTGYDDTFLDTLLADTPNLDLLESGRAETTGETLSIIDVTMADPKQEVHLGEVWRLGRHTLVVAKLRSEWSAWVPYLTEGVQFCPYPDPYLTMSELARTTPFLLVQPNTYLAGHLIDKHRSAFTGEVVELVGGGAE